jgi:ligand-binding sensor domain-containing protein
MKTSKETILFLLLTLLLNEVVGQKIIFENYTTRSGLSDNNVISLLEDKQGFIWIGTDEGLNRYDGYSFKIYKYKPGVQKGLIHNNAKCLFQDKEGYIWIGSHGGGLTRMNPVTEEFIHFKHNNDPNSISSDHITSFAEDGDYIWIGTYGGGLNRYNKKSKIFEHFNIDKGFGNNLKSNYINTLWLDSYKILWIGTWQGGLSKYNTTTNTLTTYLYPTISSSTINSITEDLKGNLWIGTWDGGLIQYNRETDSFNSYTDNFNNNSASGNIVRSTAVDK